MVGILITTIAFLCVIFAILGIASKISGVGAGDMLGTALTCGCVLLVFTMIIASNPQGLTTIPFYNLEKWATVGGMMTNAPLEFVKNVTRLLVVTFIMSMLKSIFPINTGGTKLITKLMPTISLVIGCIIINIFVYPSIIKGKAGELIFSIANGLAGGAILATEVFSIVSSFIYRLTGIKDEQNSFIVAFVEHFKNSAVGKAVQSSTISSATFIGYLLVIEKIVGPLHSALIGLQEILIMIGPIAIMLVGFALMFKSLKI